MNNASYDFRSHGQERVSGFAKLVKYGLGGVWLTATSSSSLGHYMSLMAEYQTVIVAAISALSKVGWYGA
ncbi:hypothetical protein ACGRL8_02255 [Vibrio rumoiensis]|uniref:Uncharacterized protein n=1 Tax=Vibrio rumoiensis TaxID=76258 RepID=A0ABW7ITP0_9VIBR